MANQKAFAAGQEARINLTTIDETDEMGSGAPFFPTPDPQSRVSSGPNEQRRRPPKPPRTNPTYMHAPGACQEK
jgi:hypothetical protein